MSVARCLTLSAWYHATRPWRWWHNWHAARRGRAPIMVLFYHRVADKQLNPWTITNHQFARHVSWLARNFDCVSLAEAQRRLTAGKNPRPAVCLTFDDGYADNCDIALPLLAERRIPCTYFVTTAAVLEGKPFPHDVAAGCPLQPNTVDQLRSMLAQGVEIGVHTRTHPDLGSIADSQQLASEVLGARADLELALGVRPRYFAFPFGLPRNLNARAAHMARDAGFSAVCSAYGGYNLPGDDAFHLRRIHADPQLVMLKNWLTVDPRKLLAGRRTRSVLERAP